MEVTPELIQKFEKLLKKQLKLSACSLRKERGVERSYIITTQNNDVFWLYWYDFPEVCLMFRPTGRPYCGQTTIYERTIRSHIEHCISLLKSTENQ